MATYDTNTIIYSFMDYVSDSTASCLKSMYRMMMTI